MIKPIFVGLACCAAFLTPPLTQAQARADLIIRNANIWTVDPARPQAEAVVVLEGRIVAVGSNKEADAWRGAHTRVVDARGKRLLPGFNDAHVHFAEGGADLENVQLNDANSAAEIARRITAQASSSARGEWITGGAWDETKWQQVALPSRALIDRLTPNNPVAVDRYDGHMILANTLALKLAGITASTPDPAGGVIVRDPAGNPTGVLKDAAADLVFKVIPPLSHQRLRHAIEHALSHAASLGITSVQDMNPNYADIAIYAELLEEHRLTTRIYAAPLITQVEDQIKLGIRHAFGGPYLRIGAVKAYADGSLGSSTAYFFAPFADDPRNRGLLSEQMQPLSLMRERMRQADQAGLQICTHAIGDAGISATLDLYAQLQARRPQADRRWRIEHAQHLAEKDFDRFAQLGVIASMQPYHAIDDGRWAESRIGHERASRSYAWRTMLNHKVRLAFGTDWPVAPLDPLLTLYAAVTRAPLDGRQPQGWFPEQKLSINEAIKAYTLDSAYAEFQDTEKGSISIGKLADLVLLNEDILLMEPAAIRRAKVVATWVGGEQTYAAAGDALARKENTNPK